MARNLSHSLTLVLLFSVLAGMSSGFFTAITFMPTYSQYYNWRHWAPGLEEVLVLGQVAGVEESRVIHVASWADLPELGLPANRLWLFDAKAAAAPTYALTSHGVWLANRLRLGDEITLDLATGPQSVPVAGVWHPFHPQLGENWVVLVGDTELSTATGAVLETLSPVQDVPEMPKDFRGRHLIAWLLFNALGFILYGALGLAEIKGRIAAIGWGVKLCAGGAVATLVGLVTAALVFYAFSSLPLLCLLPMTFAVMAASYFLAVVLLTGLCMAVSRI